jgi:hypothetical protein
VGSRSQFLGSHHLKAGSYLMALYIPRSLYHLEFHSQQESVKEKTKMSFKKIVHYYLVSVADMIPICGCGRGRIHHHYHHHLLLLLHCCIFFLISS